MSMFQARSSEIGRWFHGTCADLLVSLGYTVNSHPRFDDVGVEIDIHAYTDAVNLLIECKATDGRSRRPGGLRDTDNVKKAFADAVLVMGDPVLGGQFDGYVVMATHLAENGRAKAMCDVALERGYWRRVIDPINDVEGVDWLRGIAKDGIG